MKDRSADIGGPAPPKSARAIPQSPPAPRGARETRDGKKSRPWRSPREMGPARSPTGLRPDPNTKTARNLSMLRLLSRRELTIIFGATGGSALIVTGGLGASYRGKLHGFW